MHGLSLWLPSEVSSVDALGTETHV
jgi:hypothetical protein